MPTVTGAEAMCEVGALATLSISYYDLAAKAAEMAYDILVNGKKPAEMPIEYLTDGWFPNIMQISQRHWVLQSPKGWSRLLKRKTCGLI